MVLRAELPAIEVVRGKCIGSGGQPGDYGPVGYQRAFQHIHDIFQAAGAYNVAFVWAVASIETASQQQLDQLLPRVPRTSTGLRPRNMDTTTPGANAVQQMFGAWYTQFSTYGKPMMISETRAISGQQASYLDDLAAALSPPSTRPPRWRRRRPTRRPSSRSFGR